MLRTFVIAAVLGGLSDLLHSEYDSTYVTDDKPLLAGSGTPRIVPRFSPLGSVRRGAGTVSASAVVGAGNGAIGAVTADTGADEGVYNVVIIEPSANGGAFEVYRPGGELDGTGTVGAAYNGMINFTLADGATDFAAGDRIAVTVDYAEGSGKIVLWDPSATNGAQKIVGLACFDARAEVGVDDRIAFLARGPLIVRKERIAWPAGTTEQQKADAFMQLKALGIEPRTSG